VTTVITIWQGIIGSMLDTMPCCIVGRHGELWSSYKPTSLFCVLCRHATCTYIAFWWNIFYGN